MSIYNTNSGALQEFWNSLSLVVRFDFESKYGSWSSFQTDQEKYTAFHSYAEELKEQERVESLKAMVGGAIQSATSQQSEVLKSVSYELLKAIERVSQTQANTHSAISDRLNTLERRIEERPTDSSQLLQISQPQGSKPTLQVSAPAMVREDCRYDGKKGPVGCILHITQSDGSIHQYCTIAQTIAQQRRVGLLITSMYDKTHCPSSPIPYFRCHFIDEAERGLGRK